MKWRRGAAAVCGAFVLWLAAVCAGSQDLRAAAQAVRDSSLAQRLVQWELGDLWAADSLPLPVLTVLRQSPMLLAAETQVTQAETPRNAEETPSPAPVEAPEGPTTEQTENTGGQGESRPLSVVAAGTPVWGTCSSRTVRGRRWRASCLTGRSRRRWVRTRRRC